MKTVRRQSVTVGEAREMTASRQPEWVTAVGPNDYTETTEGEESCSVTISRTATAGGGFALEVKSYKASVEEARLEAQAQMDVLEQTYPRAEKKEAKV